ncbi:mevalonate kinase [Streptomyces sp. NPDC126514]|uniref:mevalonate kinase n=1 Tax=Streptomyces sp. NPDC126514 TaxID=3155210 RepID=UPI003329E72B
MKERSVQHVPGKVILIGEHAVLHAQPAIATCIPPRLTLTATLGPPGHGGRPADTRLRDALATAAAFFGLDPRRITIRTRSQLAIGAGLGSSAALSVALVRALADLCGTASEGTQLLQAATDVEHAFHGRSSGLDIHAVASGGLIWYEPGPNPQASPLAVPEPFDLVVAMSGQRRSTAAPVRALAPAGGSAAAMARLGARSRQARTALISGETEALGRAMNGAHEELIALGVSTPVLDRMVTLARAAGAVGAKLTGAGHGGAVIALAPTHTRQVLAALRTAGFDTFLLRVPTAAVDGAPCRPPPAGRPPPRSTLTPATDRHVRWPS